jgi:hypothetical protein
MLIRDVLMVLLAMALFIFALQPREHAHGQRRREADNVSSVHGDPPQVRRHRYDAEAREDALVRPTFGAAQ